MDAARHPREPARVALADYTDAIRAGWTDGDLIRAILHDLPRNFRSLGRETQQRVLNQRPPSTGTRWDALLAATVEHLCELHEQQPPAWLEERERFLEITWILPTTPTMVKEAIAFAPAAFIRHGALPDPRCLDARGGERHEWVPGSQPHHEAVRDALGETGRTRDSGPVCTSSAAAR